MSPASVLDHEQGVVGPSAKWAGRSTSLFPAHEIGPCVRVHATPELDRSMSPVLSGMAAHLTTKMNKAPQLVVRPRHQVGARRRQQASMRLAQRATPSPSSAPNSPQRWPLHLPLTSARISRWNHSLPSDCARSSD